MPSAPTEIMATAASPLILAFFPVRSNKTELPIVTGRTSKKLSVKFNAVAIAIVPKATLDNPCPIKEKRFKTSVTPRSDEHRAISTPTSIA
jgi:hypothetical protein